MPLCRCICSGSALPEAQLLVYGFLLVDVGFRDLGAGRLVRAGALRVVAWRLDRTGALRELVGRLDRTGALRELVGRLDRTGVLRVEVGRRVVTRLGALLVVAGRLVVARVGALRVVAGRLVVERVGVARRVVTGVCRAGVARRAVDVARVGEACRVAVAELVVRLCGCCAVAFTERRAASAVVLRAVAVVARCAGAVLGLSTARRPVLVVAADRCGFRPVTSFAANRLAVGETRFAAEVRLTEEPRVPA